MQWFKHKSDARNSLKLRKVRRRYGADGYAIYWFCLEAIAYEVDKDNLTFELKEDAETIAFELNIQEKRVEEIMLFMVEIGLFESSSNMITCMKLAESIDKSMTNSPKMRAWLETKSVMTSPDVIMTLPDSVSTCAELEVEKKRVEVEKNKDLLSVKTDAVQVLQYINENYGKNYKPTTKSHLENINARLNEGATVEECKAVIDFKYQDWKGTTQEQYFRPQTLFQPSKFDGYLAASKIGKPRNVNTIGTDFSAPEGWN